MSLSTLLLAVFLILLGITWLGWVAISTTFLGVWALVTGIVWLLEAYHPIPLWTRPQA
jgi:uncharacterized membrane protein HdeD (DUF308 family)